MSLTERVFLWVGIIAATVATSTQVAAITTTETQFLIDSPLIVSGFERATDSSQKSFLQLYNAGSSIIDLNGWSITTTSSLQSLLPKTIGVLAPKHHIVASYNGAVNVAADSPRIIELSRPIGAGESIKITPPVNSGYKITDIIQATKLTNPNDVWLRRMTSTGYSTATSPYDELGLVALSQLTIMNDGLYSQPAEPQLKIIEIYPYASDCAPNDISVLCGDYIKLYNPTSDIVYLDDIVLRTDSSSSSSNSSNTFTLSGEIGPDEYMVVHRTDNNGRISLTNSGGYVWLEDFYGLARYDQSITRYEGATSDKQGWSYAQIDGSWQWTMTPQPLSQNILTMPVPVVELAKPCPAGQYRNPDTNRCRTIEEAVNALASCPEGQERNSATNRCRSVLAATTSLVPCGEGQERNPTTNRCRSIASAVAELIPCDEGYERNPATNRCRKLVGVSSVGGSLTQPAESGTSKTIIDNPYAIATVIALGGVAYAVYEWRSEVFSGYKKLASKLGRK